MAAPIASKVLGEVLPYLELKQDNAETAEEIVTIQVPDIRYKTVKEAKKLLKEMGIEMEIKNKDDINEEESIITLQIPSPGIQLNTNNKIIVDVN